MIEKEVIDLFQCEKRRELGIRIIFAATVVCCESFLLFAEASVEKWINIYDGEWKAFIIPAFAVIIVAITLVNVCKLANFIYWVINYEKGLKKLAVNRRKTYPERSEYKKITKVEFLDRVNNIEVLADRIIRNHMHKKTRTAHDSDFKRAICVGITDQGELNKREEWAKSYNRIIKYRNLLLQDDDLKDSGEVGLGEILSNLIDSIFGYLLHGELLTGIHLCNLTIKNADLEKASFRNSLFMKMLFVGPFNLNGADFRESTLNDVVFDAGIKEDSIHANCSNIDFTGCKLINITFKGNITLERAIFAKADLSGMGCIGSEDREGKLLNLEHSIFSYANMDHQDFFNVSFCFADFSNARMAGSRIGKSSQKKDNTLFDYAKMEQADMRRCEIERCSFRNAVLNDSVFIYTKISDVSFLEANLCNTTFVDSEIRNCDFRITRCSDISLKNARIDNTSFSCAVMISADMSGAGMNDVLFDDSVCSDTLWIGTTIYNSSFERCVLADCRMFGDALSKAYIHNCSFVYSNLCDSAITNVVFENCDFKGADFSRARLINVQFINCKNLDTVLSDEIFIAETTFEGSSGKKMEDKHGNWRTLEGNRNSKSKSKSKSKTMTKSVSNSKENKSKYVYKHKSK